MTGLVLSLLMLCALSLLIGVAVGWRRGMPRTKLTLMLVAAAVMAANVAIWTVPLSGGDTLAEQSGD